MRDGSVQAEARCRTQKSSSVISCGPVWPSLSGKPCEPLSQCASTMASVMAAPTRRGKGKAANKRAELPNSILTDIRYIEDP